jgi:hypothetical protein
MLRPPERFVEIEPNDFDEEPSTVATGASQQIMEQLAERIRFRYVLLILFAVAVTIVASSAIAVVASRSLNKPSSSATTTSP